MYPHNLSILFLICLGEAKIIPLKTVNKKIEKSILKLRTPSDHYIFPMYTPFVTDHTRTYLVKKKAEVTYDVQTDMSGIVLVALVRAFETS